MEISESIIKDKITEVDARAKVLKPVWDQILADIKRYDGEKYVLKGYHGETNGKPIEGVANVTSAMPSIFTDSMIQVLTIEKPRCNITWKGDTVNHDEDIALLELWVRTVLQMADERRKGIGSVDLYGTAVFSSMFSLLCSISLFISLKDKTKGVSPFVDIFDSQTVTWDEYTDEDMRKYLGYVCIDSMISKQRAIDQYGMSTEKNLWQRIISTFNSMAGTTTTDIKCRDLWFYITENGEKKVVEVVLLNNEAVKQSDWSIYGVKEIPCPIFPIMSKPMVTGRTMDKFGECIFGNARGILDNYNTAATLQLTEALQSLVPPLLYSSKNGGFKPAHGEYLSFGDIQPVSTDNEEAVTLANPQRSSQSVIATNAFKQSVDLERQMALIQDSYSGAYADTGTIGVIDRKNRLTSKILNARKIVLEQCYERWIMLLYNQFISMQGSNVFIVAEPKEGGEKKITGADLKKFEHMFTVKFEVTAVEPMGDAEKIATQKALLDARVPMAECDRQWDVDNPTRLAADRVKEASLSLDPTLYLFELQCLKQKEFDLAKVGSPEKLRLENELGYLEAVLKLKAKQIMAQSKQIDGGQNGGQKLP